MSTGSAAGVREVAFWDTRRVRRRYNDACAAWTAATGLTLHRPASGESWDAYRARVGPPPAGGGAVLRARLGCL